MLDWGWRRSSCWSLQAFIGVILDGGTSSWRTDHGKEDNLKPGGWADITWHLAGNSSIERAAFTEIGNKSFEAWTECDIFTLCADVNWHVAGKSVTERDALSETVNKLSSDWTEHNVFTLYTRSFWQVPLWGHLKRIPHSWRGGGRLHTSHSSDGSGTDQRAIGRNHHFMRYRNWTTGQRNKRPAASHFRRSLTEMVNCE